MREARADGHAAPARVLLGGPPSAVRRPRSAVSPSATARRGTAPRGRLLRRGAPWILDYGQAGVSNEHEAPTYRKFLRRTRRFSSSFTKPSVMSGEMLKQDVVGTWTAFRPRAYGT